MKAYHLFLLLAVMDVAAWYIIGDRSILTALVIGIVSLYGYIAGMYSIKRVTQ